MTAILNFSARSGSRSVAINPTAASQRVVINDGSGHARDLYVYNASDHDVAVKTGDVTVVAVLPAAASAAPADMVIPAGGTMTISFPDTDTNIAAIASGTATGNIYFTPGEGA